MKKVEFSGGFHNVPAVTLRVSDVAYEGIQDVRSGDLSVCQWAQIYLSYGQRQKLEKHFCGIKGCRCGSYARATIE